MLVLPGVTQQNLLTREEVINAANRLLGVELTAAEGEILDPENTTFISNHYATITFVPVARESRSAQRLVEELFGGKEDFAPIFLGMIFVDQHPTFPKGLYQIFLTSKGVLQFISQDGNVVFEAAGQITRPDHEIDPATVPWKLTLKTEGIKGMPAAESVSASNSYCIKGALAAAADGHCGCVITTICTRVRFLFIPLWEVCTDVLVCACWV